MVAYQHVWSSQKSVHQNKEDRSKFLGSLASALRATPARDTLLLAGDFNSQLHASLVESHRLVALNTWSSGRGHTYVQGDTRTQIYYIFTFPNSSRGQAKQAKPVPQLGLGGWKKGGHIPVLAAVRPVRHWNLPKESRSAPPHCASSLEAAVRAHSPPAQAMQAWVDSQLQSAALPPDSINSVLIQGAARFFPKRVSTVKPVNARHRATLRMWQRLQHISVNTASSTLTDADSSQLKEDLATWHRQAVTLARKQRAREFQDEVEEACRKGDAYLAHKTLRKLRPWEPQTRAQLQSSEGSLLTPQEELTMLETHVTKIFAKYPQLNHTVHSLPDISGTLLAKHIGSIRPHKAVPTGSAPAAAWKLCASSAGASLAAHLSSQAGHRPCRPLRHLKHRLRMQTCALSPNHLSRRQLRATFDRSASSARMGRGYSRSL